MAENLSIKKSPVECVLECPLCLHQLTLPQTLEQCLHSYCKSCLDKVPQKTQDGRQGRLCPMCENFTKCDQVQQNTFIEELQKIHTQPDKTLKCGICSDDCGPATWKCTECKIGLCENGKAVHGRIPTLQCHQVTTLDNERDGLIDNIVFCKVHDNIPAQLNCRDCDQLICYTCIITDHKQHYAETIEQALEIILPKTESCMTQVDENISVMEAQIEGVKTKIEETREAYASIRMQMDDHLEKVICQMKAMKAQMEEDVNQQESIALDTLKELQQQLEKQLSQARIISSLTAVVSTKTRHTSQLQQLQSGLFEKVKSASASKIGNLHFQLPEAKFIEGHRTKEKLENIFGGLSFELKGNSISTSDEVRSDNDGNFMCYDFEEIVVCQFDKSLEINIGSRHCNRVSYIDEQFVLPLWFVSKIKLYNKDGKLVKTIDNGGRSITVVKQACNGDLICGALKGLYITDKDFTEWTRLEEGTFSDVVVHQSGFYALEYKGRGGCIHKYSLMPGSQWQMIQQCKLTDTTNNFQLGYNSTLCFSGDHFFATSSTNKVSQWQNIQQCKLTDDTTNDLELSVESTLCFSGNHFWVTSSANKEIYKFSDAGKYLQKQQTGNVDPRLFGVDQKGKVLIADYTDGKFDLLDTNQKDKIAVKEIWNSVKCEKVMDAVLDSNNHLWTLSGSKLTKFKKK